MEKILMEVCDDWAQIAGPDTPCPISFSEKQRAQHTETMRRFVQEGEINALIEEIGVQPDGWVPLDRLDEAIARNREVREKHVAGLEEHDRERIRQCWPFQVGFFRCLNFGRRIDCGIGWSAFSYGGAVPLEELVTLLGQTMYESAEEGRALGVCCVSSLLLIINSQDAPAARAGSVGGHLDPRRAPALGAATGLTTRFLLARLSGQTHCHIAK